jgi:hypothetical protein
MIYHGCLVFMLCDQVTPGPSQRFPGLFGGFPIGAQHAQCPSHSSRMRRASRRINIETTFHCLRKSKFEECIFFGRSLNVVGEFTLPC